MDISFTLDRLHSRATANRWMRHFAVFNRIALAAGFLPAGIIKIAGKRFASGLSVNHPMGHYLEALHHTGYYYTFIGILQVSAAILLLIPHTALLGALIYFPIILNICILSFAVRFEGSLISSTLMVMANLYLLLWYYDKLKFILPLNRSISLADLPKKKILINRFPVTFFAGVVTTIVIAALVIDNAYSIMPRNTLSDCNSQCKDSKKSRACHAFCDCIYQSGESLDSCLAKYANAPKDGDSINYKK